MGIILVFLPQGVVDKLFLPTSDIRTEVGRDQNLAAVLMVCGVRMVLMMAIGAVI